MGARYSYFLRSGYRTQGKVYIYWGRRLGIWLESSFYVFNRYAVPAGVGVAVVLSLILLFYPRETTPAAPTQPGQVH